MFPLVRYQDLHIFIIGFSNALIYLLFPSLLIFLVISLVFEGLIKRRIINLSALYNKFENT